MNLTRKAVDMGTQARKLIREGRRRRRKRMWSRRRKAVRANTVNNADTERDRATPVQDIDMYVCMYVCMYMNVCMYVS